MNFKIIILVFTAVFFIIMSTYTGHPGVNDQRKTRTQPLRLSRRRPSGPSPQNEGQQPGPPPQQNAGQQPGPPPQQNAGQQPGPPPQQNAGQQPGPPP
ncbi:proline-rich protein HaeIII subfamily 1-like [Adelges cooleyi]|uniref:proline-rich protein HaeIII subfamily 1-like n=1 Tax=Adelges cooleyi TaxID=133065 RepID=UPI00218026C7|nr:proline-rich protein HaeIII subfamily 1-like [Adelges cooleyi]